MDFVPARLRKGEIIVGAGSLVLLASMFVLKWFGLNTAVTLGGGQQSFSISVNG